MGCVNLKANTVRGPKRRSILELNTPKKVNRQKIEQLQSDRIRIENKNLVTKNMSKFIHEYKIIKSIGEGSFGAVYKVFHLETKVVRALKTINKQFLKYQDDDSEFLKEIEILMAIDHPNIVKIFEYFEDRKSYFIIVEYIPGGELFDHISKWEYFSEQKAAYIFQQLVSAVNYLHNKGIAHRDLKPENIIIDNCEKSKSGQEEVNIKLIDFGTCSYVSKSSFLTTKIGTPYYIAPEVLEGKYNEQCDMWSCGVILYVLLVGYHPFTGNTTAEILEQVKKANLLLNTDEWESVSEAAKELIRGLLEVDPKKRITSKEALNHYFFKIFRSETEVNTKNMKQVMIRIRRCQVKEKLQQATVAYIVRFCSENEDLERLKKVFKKLDLNGDGMLGYEELVTGYKQMFGEMNSEDAIKQIMDEVDMDKDGFISYEEFLRVSINKKDITNEKYLKQAFNHFDSNGDGVLSFEEVKDALATDEDDYIEQLFKEIDLNKDGFLSFEEFKGLMKILANNTFLGSQISSNEVLK